MTAPRAIPQAKSAQPVLSTGTGLSGVVVSAVARPATQIGSPALLLEVLDAFDVYHPNAKQLKVLLVSLPIVFSAVQNLVEYVKGRRLIGVRAPD